MIVACVLKSGGWQNQSFRVEYGPEHVLWMRDMLAKHITIPYEFVCLTDMQIPSVRTIPLLHNLPGWWSKIELFRSDIFAGEAVFYLDLDTVVTQNIDHILQHKHSFTTLCNMSAPNDPKRIGSGLMAWSGDRSRIFKEFMQDPEGHMARCAKSSCWGDQGFIQPYVKDMPRFQKLFPQQIVSFKIDLQKKDPTSKNRIICFHGKPKPEELSRPWIPPLPR